MRSRALTITLAVGLAVLGTTGVLLYVKGADARAVAGQQAVSVLVADEPLPAGTSAGAAQRSGQLRIAHMPAAAVPADALASITPDLADLVTGAELVPGQLLLRPLLIPVAQATAGLVIPPGKLAMSMALCLPESVAGFVRAGSQIAIFDTAINGGGKAKPGCNGEHEQQGAAVTRALLPKVQVLSVGAAPVSGDTAQAAATQGDRTDVKVLLTLAVDQGEAELLITAARSGMPYLALLGGDAGAVVAAAPNR